MKNYMTKYWAFAICLFFLASALPVLAAGFGTVSGTCHNQR